MRAGAAPRPGLPPVLADAQVAVVRGDVADLPALLDLGTRHKITGIVHLAGSMPWPIGADEPIPATRRALGGLLNIFQVAREWGVRRVGVASTIGVYHGASAAGALREDLPLPMNSAHVIPTFKKIGELLDDWLAPAVGLDVVNYRISGTWGPRRSRGPVLPGARPRPRGRPRHRTRPVVAGRNTVRRGRPRSVLREGHAGARSPCCTWPTKLNHRTYNVASGRATSNADVIAAIKTVVPAADLSLPSRGSVSPASWLDITRLHEDTGYVPSYDTERAAADYIAWLRAGNDR